MEQGNINMTDLESRIESAGSAYRKITYSGPGLDQSRLSQTKSGWWRPLVATAAAASLVVAIASLTLDRIDVKNAVFHKQGDLEIPQVQFSHRQSLRVNSKVGINQPQLIERQRLC